MRKTVALALAMLAFAALPAAAAHASVPTGVVGTYSWHEPGGYRVTVGYVPCGLVIGGTLVDPEVKYYGRVKHGGDAAFEIWAHQIANLDSTMRGQFGFGLTQEAIDTLTLDDATYTCTG